MRKSIWIICIVILVICAWLLLHHNTKQEPNTASIGRAMPTNQPAAELVNQFKQSKVPAKSQTPQESIAGTVPPRPAGGIELSNWLTEQMQADWQKPIVFYGKVVDENSNRVAGASIRFQWVDMSDNITSNIASTQSDGEGLFSFQGKRGRSLDVSVDKDGYYNSKNNKTGFLYSLGPDIYSPDPQNPIVFKLHKKGKGESLITSSFPTGIGEIAQLHHDGSPVELDLIKGVQAPAGGGQLKLEFWRAITNRNANVFDWKCQLTVSGGGLAETPEEFAFQAPENGYKPSLVIDMSVTNQPWMGEVRSRYYMQLPDGKYGRFDFYFSPFNGTFTVQSAINPTGTRNLEPK